jgi:hypothetical protein
MNKKSKKMLLFVKFLIIHLRLITSLEQKPPEREPHRITAPAPAPTK